MDAETLAAYRVAAERTSETLHRAWTLCRALYDLALEHPLLGSSDINCEALVPLIVVIEEKTEQAAMQHQDEWDLMVKPAVTERGK